MKRQGRVSLLYPSFCWNAESFINPAISAESIMSCLDVYKRQALHKAGIVINRKVLADLAMNHPEAFKAIVAKAKAA